MITSLYQQYLFVIGKLKDSYKLSVETEHRDSHTFYLEKRPLFKLLFGSFEGIDGETIVTSFHAGITVLESITWWNKLNENYPMMNIADSWYEDAAGEIYFGEDAFKLLDVAKEQNVLEYWLSNHDTQDIKDFIKHKTIMRTRDPKQSYNSNVEKEDALEEFNLMKKPVNDEDVQ